MKDYTCECCNKTWQSKTHFNRHMTSKKNTGEPRKPDKPHKERCDKKIYACGLCGKTYRNNYDLNKHTSCKNKNTVKIN